MDPEEAGLQRFRAHVKQHHTLDGLEVAATVTTDLGKLRAGRLPATADEVDPPAAELVVGDLVEVHDKQMPMGGVGLVTRVFEDGRLEMRLFTHTSDC